MKIVYLHGLESNVNQKDPKIIFLNNNFDEVFTPSINYKDKNTFAKLFSKIKAINPDLIVGSSMGGYFAYLIGSKLSIETVLFNPAVVGRAFDPIVDDTNLSGARHNVFLGKSDNVISGKDIKSYLDSNGVGNFKYRSYKGGHRVPEDTFINSIKNIAGIKENDSSQIYTKRKYIKMKHIKTSKSINEAKMPFSVEYFDMGEWFEYEYDGGYKSEKDAMEVAKEIADSSGDKVRILKNGKKVKLYESSEFVGGMINEAVLSLPAFAALMLTTGILGRLGLMSDDKFDKLVGQTKSDVKGIGKIFKQGFLDYAKLLPVVGKKLKYKALQNLQKGEVAKYLKDEITDADIVKILKEDPKLKTMIEDIANGSKRYSDLYNHLRSIGGHKEGTWGEGMIANKFKKLRAKIAKGSLDESVNEGKKYTVSDFKVGDRVIIARGETKPGVVKKVTKAPNDLVYVSWNPKRPSDESQAFRAHELIPESVTEAKGWNAVAKVMDAALKKANVSLSYAKEYAKSLEGMAKRDAKEFFADYGDFTEDDFIEDVEYNMRNESVTESLTSNYRVHSKYVYKLKLIKNFYNETY